jgi:hypothetical protein
MAMAVGILDLSVFAVDDELSFLIPAHHPASIHGVLFGISMDASPISLWLLDIPTTFGVGNNMVFFSCHLRTLSPKGNAQTRCWQEMCISEDYRLCTITSLYFIITVPVG